MKAVSGEVVSSKPVSLSKAAKILSKFASSDNGASPAFAAYLKRASASFDELAQLHKKYKTSGDKQKVKSLEENIKLQEVNTKVKSNISVIKYDEIKEEHHGVNKVKEEAERNNVSLNVDEEKKHKSKKRIKDEEKRHKSKNRIKDEEEHKSKKRSRDEGRHD